MVMSVPPSCCICFEGSKHLIGEKNPPFNVLSSNMNYDNILFQKTLASMFIFVSNNKCKFIRKIVPYGCVYKIMIRK